jgi:hypothetical protein
MGGFAVRYSLLSLACLTLLTCHPVILTAPAGSTLFLSAHPPFIAANGGVSVITVLVTRPDGIGVADGTVVQFFTNLGQINDQATTIEGVARVNLVADSRSGIACVTAFSGGPATTPTTTPPSTTPSPSPSPSPSPVASATGCVRVDQASNVGCSSADTVAVTIGNLNASFVKLTSDSTRILQGRPATLTANVFDASGNTVANVPVIFSIQQSGTDTHPLEGLLSGSVPQFTDTNGQAFDTLFTRQDPSNPESTVTVVATAATKVSDTIVVTIN